MQHKTIYTIMPDYGRAYGWIIKDGDETRGVGPNHAGFGGWGGDHQISDDLQDSFSEWQDVFESADCLPAEPLKFAWDSFHAQGVALARRLKVELGEAARVIYEKPYEDPAREIDERREVLLDGSLFLLKSRSELYAQRDKIN
jgi:hypothetical protein